MRHQHDTCYRFIQNVEPFKKYLIILAAFILNGQVIGHNYAASFLVSKMLKKYPDEEFHAALIGSVTFGLTLSCGLVMLVLVKYLNEIWIFILGIVLFSMGAIISAFIDDLRLWYLTYSLPRGLGGSILYILSFNSATRNFPNYVCTVSTIVSLGASLFTIIIPTYIDTLCKYHGLFGFLIADGLVVLSFLIFTPLFKSDPIKEPVNLLISSNPNGLGASQTLDFHVSLQEIIQINEENSIIIVKRKLWWNVFKHKKFVLFIIVSVIFFLFSNIPFIHSHRYLTKLSSRSRHEPVYFMLMVGIGAIVSKILGAILVDVKKMSVLLIYQLSLLSFGMGLIMLGTLAYLNPLYNFYTFMLYCGSFILGIGEGCIWSLLYPLCFTCSYPYTDERIFCAYCAIISLPYSLGGPLASFIYNRTKSHPAAFFIGGIVFVLSLNMFWLIGYESFQTKKELNNLLEIDIIGPGADEAVLETELLRTQSQ